MTNDIRIFNDIRTYLKAGLKPWRDAIYKRQNNRCPISQQYRSVVVHYINKSFSEIMRETFDKTGIQFRRQTMDYTPEELASLVATCLDLHKNVIGTLIARRLHEAYHQQYSNQCTLANWREFKKQFKPRRKAA